MEVLTLGQEVLEEVGVPVHLPQLGAVGGGLAGSGLKEGEEGQASGEELQDLQEQGWDSECFWESVGQSAQSD